MGACRGWGSRVGAPPPPPRKNKQKFYENFGGRHNYIGPLYMSGACPGGGPRGLGPPPRN